MSNKINSGRDLKANGGPAFPVDCIVERDEKGHLHGFEISSAGMTLRDYLSAKAMQALVTSGLNTGAWDDYVDLAKSAWAIADAMLVEREVS